MAIRKGTRVRQIVKVVEGIVTEYDVDRETGDVQLKVEWPDEDGDGEPQSRYFKEHEVEVIPEPPGAAG